MNAVTYPEAAPGPAVSTPVTPLPQPARSKLGLSAAFGVVALLVAGVAAYLLWPQATTPAPDLLVTGTAEQVVTAFLHGDRPTLERLVAFEIPDSLGEGQSYVRSAMAVSVLDGGDTWEVTVAADHLVAVPGGFGDPRTEYFLVVFADRPTGAVATALPRIVAAPDPPTVKAASWPDPPADDVTRAVETYLRWLLAGSSGVFDGTPVAPPPFADIDLVGMQRTVVEDGIDVMVAVDGVRSDGSVLPLHYSLHAAESEQGWSISPSGN